MKRLLVVAVLMSFLLSISTALCAEPWFEKSVHGTTATIKFQLPENCGDIDSVTAQFCPADKLDGKEEICLEGKTYERVTALRASKPPGRECTVIVSLEDFPSGNYLLTINLQFKEGERLIRGQAPSGKAPEKKSFAKTFELKKNEKGEVTIPRVQ